MIRLNAVDRTLEVLLAGAVTTNELAITVGYSDATGQTYNGATQLSRTNGVTAVTACDAPASQAARDIDYVVICNDDTVAATVTVRVAAAGILYDQVKASVPAGRQLIYTHAAGWNVGDINATPIGADPTALVGLAAVNGTALTFMRSDGAPGLNQAITPTWTGVHTFSQTILGNIAGNAATATTSDSTSGNAATATALQTPRTINGVSFNGTANITVPAAAGTLTGATLAAGVTASSLTSVGTLATLTVTAPIAGSVTGSSGSTSGNAATATALQTARNINGTSFNGTADITVAAAAGTLTGATLAAGVTASSLTSVGTLTSLAMAGAISGVTDLTTTGNTTLGNAVGDTIVAAGGSYRLTATGLSLFGGLAAAISSAPVQLVAPSSANAFTIAGRSSDDAAVFNFTTNTGSADKARFVVSADNSVSIANGSGATTRFRVSATGQIEAQTLGVGFAAKEGANAKQGVATLVAGTVTVANTSITANSRIFLTIQSLGTVLVPSAIGVTARVVGTSFTITSAAATDTSVIGYEIFEPS